MGGGGLSDQSGTIFGAKIYGVEFFAFIMHAHSRRICQREKKPVCSNKKCPYIVPPQLLWNIGRIEMTECENVTDGNEV